MNFKKVSISLIFLNLISIAVAWFLLNNQSEKYNANLANLEAKIEQSKLIQKTESPIPPVTKAVVVADVPKTIQIPIYTKNGSSGRVFTTFKNRDELIVVDSSGEWSQVVSIRGFPAWVRGDLVENFSKGYVKVVVNTANARTSPKVTSSVLLGQLQRDDVLKVNRKQGKWIRVWSPIKFKAWVKSSDLG